MSKVAKTPRRLLELEDLKNVNLDEIHSTVDTILPGALNLIGFEQGTDGAEELARRIGSVVLDFKLGQLPEATPPTRAEVKEDARRLCERAEALKQFIDDLYPETRSALNEVARLSDTEDRIELSQIISPLEQVDGVLGALLIWAGEIEPPKFSPRVQTISSAVSQLARVWLDLKGDLPTRNNDYPSDFHTFCLLVMKEAGNAGVSDAMVKKAIADLKSGA